MTNPTQESTAREQSRHPLLSPQKLCFSDRRTEFRMLIIKLTERAKSRLLTACGWILNHRREASAMIVVAMMASTFMAQSARQQSHLSQTEDAEFIGVEQLLSSFDNIRSGTSATQAETNTEQIQGATILADALDSAAGQDVASAMTTFAVRSATIGDTSTPNTKKTETPSALPIIRISRTTAFADPANAAVPGPEIRPYSADALGQNNRSPGTSPPPPATVGGIRFRGGIEPISRKQ